VSFDFPRSVGRHALSLYFLPDENGRGLLSPEYTKGVPGFYLPYGGSSPRCVLDLFRSPFSWEGLPPRGFSFLLICRSFVLALSPESVPPIAKWDPLTHASHLGWPSLSLYSFPSPPFSFSLLCCCERQTRDLSPRPKATHSATAHVTDCCRAGHTANTLSALSRQKVFPRSIILKRISGQRGFL